MQGCYWSLVKLGGFLIFIALLAALALGGVTSR